MGGSRHNRRDGYWRLYEFAHSKELSEVVDELARLVDKVGDSWPKPKRGRPAVHSPRKMVVICVLTVIMGFSYRRMEALLRMLRLPWLGEPVPDHSTIHEAFRRMSEAYLNRLLERSAEFCVEESGWVRGVVAADSTGVETDRYETVEVKLQKLRRKINVKFHIIAVLDYNIILAAKVTSQRTGDSPTLKSMLTHLHQMEGSIFNADKAYDSDKNCELIYTKKMKPNIKQRITQGRNRGLRYRRKAAEEFDEAVYRYRGLIEGIFGAIEAGKGLKTRCRLRRTQRRWESCNSHRPQPSCSEQAEMRQNPQHNPQTNTCKR
ncbi:MAG: transposase [Candidatus Bathyarchaeia archaeon]